MDLLIETVGGVVAYGSLAAGVWLTAKAYDADRKRQLAKRRATHPATRTLRDAA